MTDPATEERLARLAARRGPRPGGPAASTRPRRSVHARIWTAGLSASAVFGGVALLAHGARPSLATPAGAPAELPPEALDAVDPTTDPADAAADPATTAPPVRITVVVVHQPASTTTAANPTGPEPDAPAVTPTPGPAPAPTRRPAAPVTTTAPPPPPAPPRATAPATRAPAPRPVATTRPS